MADSPVLTRVFLALLVALGAVGWWAAPESAIADDSYAYLVIARRLVLEGAQTFSGVFETNGFHPLWLYLLAGWAWLLAKVEPAQLDHARFVVVPATALTALAAWLLVTVAERMRWPAIVVAGVPVAFVLVFGVLGSEAHTLLAALALVLWRATDERVSTPGGAWLLGLASALATLARLDAVFVGVAVGLWLMWKTRSARTFAWFALGACPPVLVYLASNLVWFGGAMPVSGYLKSNFPIPFLKGLSGRGLALTFGGCSVWWGLVPVSLTGVALAWRRRRGAAGSSLPLAFWWAAVAQLAYVALFTRSHTGWYWYYVLPMLASACVLAALFNRLPRRRLVLGGLLLALLVAVSGRTVMRLRDNTPPVTRLVVELVRREAPAPAVTLVSDYPGYLAFASKANILAADLLTSNRPLHRRLVESGDAGRELLALSEAKGHPVRLVLWLGQQWLVPSDDGRSLVFNDPRRYPELVPIGEIPLHDAQPLSDFGIRGAARAWRLPADD